MRAEGPFENDRTFPLTEEQKQLAIAEDQYREAIRSQEQASDSNSTETALVTHAFTLRCPDDSIRRILKLELNAKEFIIRKINACAEVAFKTMPLAIYSEHANEIAAIALRDALEMLAEPDRRQLNQIMLQNVAERAVAHWIRKAQTLSPTRDSHVQVLIQLPRAQKEHYDDYPKVKYSWNRVHKSVNSLDEEIELGPGWADDVLTLERYERMPFARPDDSELLKWVDEWQLSNLGDCVKTLIRHAVLNVAEVFWADPEEPGAEIEAMRSMFRQVADVLFQAGILTDRILNHELSLLVWDTAIAGGWWRLAAETRTEIFPHRLGHYWGWLENGRDWQRLFQSKNLRWMDRLSHVTDAPPSQALREPNGAVQSERHAVGAIPNRARTDRQLEVDAYIEEVLRVTGKRITRTDFWRKAGDKSRTEFERWESYWYEGKGMKGNQAADERYRRILTEKPHLK